MKLLTKLSTILGILALTSCGLPTNSPESPKFPEISTPSNIDTSSIDTIVLSDDYVEDTTTIVVTNTFFKIANPYFTSETHEDVKRLVIEWKEGEVSFCKLNNTILYSYADKKVSHEYKYLSANIIQIQEGNTLDAIAIDHNTTTEKLRVLNPGLGKVLQIGKTIKTQ
jgi:LysM repeat protein